MRQKQKADAGEPAPAFDFLDGHRRSRLYRAAIINSNRLPVNLFPKSRLPRRGERFASRQRKGLGRSDRTASLDAQTWEALTGDSGIGQGSSVPLAPENIGASVVWADRAAQKLAVMSR